MVAAWWVRLTQRLRDRLVSRREEGQGLVEYALILALIATFVIIALHFLQPNISLTLNSVANGL